ncbi:hypothetical protein SAMN04487996_1335 [Dyadobacter soli]|uniref:Uncharacterized protein n=1 Tax=Dyadobacter soli TaxID=659014 RepID=A0A1G8BD25_9BACT|nr:hypothetical protein SAMN04487996_1335 [Dyadobacter soli]
MTSFASSTNSFQCIPNKKWSEAIPTIFYLSLRFRVYGLKFVQIRARLLNFKLFSFEPLRLTAHKLINSELKTVKVLVTLCFL